MIQNLYFFFGFLFVIIYEYLIRINYDDVF